jgi:hypothetical protein
MNRIMKISGKTAKAEESGRCLMADKRRRMAELKAQR